MLRLDPALSPHPETPARDDTINLDIAVSDKEERKHLVKTYIGQG